MLLGAGQTKIVVGAFEAVDGLPDQRKVSSRPPLDELGIEVRVHRVAISDPAFGFIRGPGRNERRPQLPKHPSHRRRSRLIKRHVDIQRFSPFQLGPVELLGVETQRGGGVETDLGVGETQLGVAETQVDKQQTDATAAGGPLSCSWQSPPSPAFDSGGCSERSTSPAASRQQR